MRLAISLASIGLCLSLSPAFASFVTVDLSPYVNSNIAFNPASFPVGTTTGNLGTDVPFFIAQYPAGSGVEGTWNPDFADGNTGIGSNIVGVSLTVPLNSLNINGQQSVYALLNNYFGTPGADEYDVTITATDGDSVTYQSIGGVDTRDYNSAFYTNTIADTTTPWFDNGIGQRLDVREFSLPSSFADETLSSFEITQEYQGDAVLFTGLTFSDAPLVFGVPVPEPSSVTLLGFGVAGLLIWRRRFAKRVHVGPVGGASLVGDGGRA